MKTFQTQVEANSGSFRKIVCCCFKGAPKKKISLPNKDQIVKEDEPDLKKKFAKGLKAKIKKTAEEMLDHAVDNFAHLINEN